MTAHSRDQIGGLCKALLISLDVIGDLIRVAYDAFDWVVGHPRHLFRREANNYAIWVKM
jgi:hypothetical protein